MILFPSAPLTSGEIDPDFVAEADVARAAGFDVGLVSLEELLAGNPKRAVARLKMPDGPTDCIYRGWMLTSTDYARLFAALEEKGHRLRTSPEDYRRFHEFPGGHEVLSELMPLSLVFPKSDGLSPESIVERASASLAGPIVVKDYVKSRKHEWLDACFIPDIADTGNAVRVVRNFVERQGGDLTGGVVLRQFIPLEDVGVHPKSGMPIPLEFRTFFFGGEVLCSAEYWHELEYVQSTSPPIELLPCIAERMGRGFFTADTALTKDGRWIVVEVGDGQVSQIPEKQDVGEFYKDLRTLLG